MKRQTQKYNSIGLKLKSMLEKIESAKRSSNDPNYINTFIDRYNLYSTKYYEEYNKFKLLAEKYNKRADKYNSDCGMYAK